MAGVFLSYDRADLPKAHSLALALGKAGHSVWWDRNIAGGAQYSTEIEEALKRADAVVVLWSKTAVNSAWVRDEAAAGRDSSKLVPARLDSTVPPMGFRQYQTVDLSRWKGIRNASAFDELNRAIKGLAAQPTDVAPTNNATQPRKLESWRRKSLIAVVLFLAVIIGGWLVIREFREPGITTVAVAAVDTAATPLARDLLVNLAMLQSAKSGSMRLVDRDEAAGRADLIFEIGGEDRSPKPAANLVLMTGKDRTILWSEDFEQKAGGATELKQQVGFAAARILDCALEALLPANERPGPNLLKLYLNACAQLDETFFHDASQVIPILERVTAEVPGFRPAWAKLLVAETNHFQNMNSAEQKAYAGKLRRTISAARQRNPDIPEAYVAEIELLPGGTFDDQVRLIDRAVKIEPNNVFVLAARSLVMLCVGRLEEAVKDARKAARLDPLSPAIRSAHIQALLNSGQIDRARSELAEAERLWPDAPTVLDSRSRLSLQSDNIVETGEALRLVQAGRIRAGGARMAFVQARLNPTQANIKRAIELAGLAYEARPEINTAAGVIVALGEFDRTQDLLNFLLTFTDASQVPYFIEILFTPQLADLRADPRFMQIAARFSLLSYWQHSGDWPDFCSEPDLPYNCKAEAAKLS